MNYFIVVMILWNIFLFYFLWYRNNLVLNYRTKIINESLDAYKFLPGYYLMVFDIFHWPSKRLKGKDVVTRKAPVSGYQPQGTANKGKPLNPPKRP